VRNPLEWLGRSATATAAPLKRGLAAQSMTPAQRLEEVAGLLATGFLRLRLRRTNGRKPAPSASPERLRWV
jgi:hypothetical protein